MTKKTRNWLIALAILAFPFVLFFGCLIFMEEPLPPVAPLPNPNGYDDLVKAGKMLAANNDNSDATNQEQLREWVPKNAGALALARAGLSKECRVPLQFSQSYVENHLDEMADLKRLALAFVAEGKLMEMENHPGDAAKSYLDAIHLGNESARGGVLIDQLVGSALEAIGRSHLTNLVSQLDAKSSREIAATLETLDAERQTWNEVIQQENNWSRRTFPELRNGFARLMRRHILEKDFQRAEQKFKAQQIETRQLIINLAARAYELDKGHPPASAADLVPEYLKAVPQDPATGTNMVYSP